MNSEIERIYGNHVRVRVCGLCWKDKSLLLVNHKGISHNNFWAPPGGGVDFGESLETGLKREFEEETGLSVHIDRFLFVCEFIKEPLHALEFFFEVSPAGGQLKKGNDPEMSPETQIISHVRFMEFGQIIEINERERHGVFNVLYSEKLLKTANGYYKI